MAIVKVGTYRNPPEDITDYEAIVAHLNAYTRQLGSQAMILTEWTNTSGTPAIALGSYISHGGVLYVVESEEAVALPVADGTYYLKVAASGESLALSWVSDISGYAWNAIYNGLYHSDESQILPYQLVKAGAVLTKRKITNLMQGSGFVTVDWTGAVIGQALNVASINTGSGAMTFNQGVKTTDDVTFATVNTGQGATEVHLMNQNLRTNDSPTFAGYYSNNAYGNHRVSPTIVLNYTFGGSHATTQMPAMEVGMSAVVKYTPYSGDADNALVLPAGGVYVVAGSSSDSYGTAYTGALGGGSTIWLNSTSGSHSKYFFVVRVA